MNPAVKFALASLSTGFGAGGLLTVVIASAGDPILNTALLILSLVVFAMGVAAVCTLEEPV